MKRAPFVRRSPRSPNHRLESLEGRVLFSTTLFPFHESHASTLPAIHVPKPLVVPPSLLTQLATAPSITPSTIPANGDVNPYGLAFVPQGFPKGGPLQPGDLLVSNFNAASNLQGTGTTIDRITPAGQVSTFFQGPAGLGLSTALDVLRSGFIVVGSLPTTDGSSATAQPGSLLILDKFGLQIASFANAAFLNGPWDMTVNDQGSHAQLFIANALSGTVTRIDLQFPGTDSLTVQGVTQIASGYTHRGDPNALVLGPTGLAYNAHADTLYVASTADNAIFAIAHAGKAATDAGTGASIFADASHLHGPLGLVLAPNGNLIVANGDAINAVDAQPSELVEFTTAGQFVAQFSLDPAAADPFGIAVTSASKGQVRFAAVNDNHNTVSIWTIPHP